MPRPRPAASVLAAIILAAALAPLAPPTPAEAGSGCGTHRSETVPPPTIRVYRTGSGAVDTVDFRAYVKNVLSREWISSWTTESLRAGALAVKNYAWYQVNHWRGYVNTAGQCFHVFDSTRDQHYDPARPTYASMAAAVDATWSTLAHRGGQVFATYYNAGSPGEPCGANVNGWQMFQWGTQACGLAGKSAAQILANYYPGVTVSAAPSVAPPSPTPAATPTPTAAPIPTTAPTPSGATPAPSSAPSAAPSSAPSATPTPVPATPAPKQSAATPPPTPIAMPGGGQVGLAAPPPPPPPDPEPVVVAVSQAGMELALAVEPRLVAADVRLADMLDHPVVRFEQARDAALRRARATVTTPPVSVRMVLVRLVVQRTLSSLPLRLPPGH